MTDLPNTPGPIRGFDHYIGNLHINKLEELTDFLQTPLYTSGDLDVTPRQLNSWQKEGLVTFPEGKWKRYDFVEYLWVKIIKELRNFGVPMEVLRKVKAGLFEPFPVQVLAAALQQHDISKLPIEGITEEDKQGAKRLIEQGGPEAAQLWNEIESKERLILLQLLIVQVFAVKAPITILINTNGAFPIDEENWLDNTMPEYVKAVKEILSDTHIRLPLNKFIREFLTDKNLLNVLPQFTLIEENERRLLEIIHTGDYDSVTIHFKDRKMKNMELKKTEDAKRRIVDILQENQYQEIVIKTHKGLTTTIQNTIKVQL